jgi:hypothetical protein
MTVSPSEDDQSVNRQSGQDVPRNPVEVDESHLMASYANFCRVSSTPEELILDLGLNPQPLNPVNRKVQMSQRVIMNHFTAKRLLLALSQAVQRYEQTFGELEIDVRNRVIDSAKQQKPNV